MEKEKVLNEIIKCRNELVGITKVKSEKDGFERVLRKVSNEDIEKAFNKLLINLDLEELHNPLKNEDLRKVVGSVLTENQCEVFFDYVNKRYENEKIKISDYYTLRKAKESLSKYCEVGSFKSVLEPFLKHKTFDIDRGKKK